MPTTETLLVFAALSVGLWITPGPNMLYLISRSLAQGTRAGMISLAGCQAGSTVYALLGAAGITAVLLAIPAAYTALALGGAAYLAWLAWNTLKPGGRSVFEPTPMRPASDRTLFGMGAGTALLNPKVALFYVAVLPPFLDPSRGDLFVQGAILGLMQVAICTIGDAFLVVGAGGVQRFLVTRPAWMVLQRWVLGLALGALAVKLALEARRGA
jgi:threonine/homoserine/homoserine lactone efflux protein